MFSKLGKTVDSSYSTYEKMQQYEEEQQKKKDNRYIFQGGIGGANLIHKV